MKPSLKPGLTHRLTYTVPPSKTVPNLYPEAPQFRAMPEVFATGFMVGLMEWACCELLDPHYEAGEGSLGTHVDFSHSAATPPGLIVTVDAELTAIDGRKVSFFVRAHDGVDVIGEGRHERTCVMLDKFNARVADKARRAGAVAA